MKYSLLFTLITASTLSLTANAALEKRGENMAYDTVLNITWLLDANYAKTSGYAEANKTDRTGNLWQTDFRNAVLANGKMGFDAAKTWVSNLTIVDPVYGKVSGWRLPKSNTITAAEEKLAWKNPAYFYNGTANEGYNISRSEFGHMFFNNLGNKAAYNVNGERNADGGLTNTTYQNGATTIEFSNISSPAYWTGDANNAENMTYSILAWVTDTAGFQTGTLDGPYSVHYAWAVLDGDVKDIPVPAAVWLFASALVGLAGVRRRK